MNFEHKKPTVTATDVFADFKRSCEEHFQFLETEHGLQLQESQQYGREHVVVFADKQFRVTIYFEYPGPPLIAIEKKAAKSTKRKGLHQLYRRAFKKKMPSVDPDAESTMDSYDLTNLPLQSEILRHHWDKLMVSF